MSKDMKLIMENWNKYLLNEAAGEADVAKAIVGMFDLDKAEDEIEKETEEVNEIIGAGALTAGFAATVFVKIVGTLALGGLLGQISNWFHQKITGGSSNFIKSFTEIVEEAAGTLATLGLNKIVKVYINKKVLDPADKDKYIERTNQVAKIIVFIITLAAGAIEVYNGAKEAGGLSAYIIELAKSSGIQDMEAVRSVIDLFELSMDTGENSFKATQFIQKAISAIAQLLRGTP